MTMLTVRACLHCGAKSGIRCVSNRCCESHDRDAAFGLASRCTAIARQVAGTPLPQGFGVKTKMWQAAWIAACIALKGELLDFVE